MGKGKHWCSQEGLKAEKLLKKGKTYSEVAKIVSIEFDSNRTPGSIKSLNNEIKNGLDVNSFPDWEEMPGVQLRFKGKKKKDSGKRRPHVFRPVEQNQITGQGNLYSDREDNLIIDLHNRGYAGKEIFEEFQDKGFNRTYGSIRGRMMFLRRKGAINGDKKNEKKDYTEALSLTKTLESFDIQNLHPVLEERRGLVYGFMKEQADKIRNIDVSSKYDEGKLREVKKLSKEERAKIAKYIISDENSIQLGHIDLWAVPYCGEVVPSASLVLPVYIEEESSKSSAQCLGSVLNSASHALIKSGSVGLKESETRPFVGRFEDLIRYSVIPSHGKSIKFEDFSSALERQLTKRDFKEINIRVVEDDLFSNYEFKED